MLTYAQVVEALGLASQILNSPTTTGRKNVFSVSLVLIWRPRSSDSSAGRQLGKLYKCIAGSGHNWEDTTTPELVHYVRIYCEDR